MSDVALREIAEQLGGELIGDGELRIARIGSLHGATRDTISFLASQRLRAQLDVTQAGCVIVEDSEREAAAARGAVIVTSDPYAYYARLTRWWVARTRAAVAPSIHPTAVIAEGARLAPGATVGALAVIDTDASIAEGAVIGAQCIVGAGSRVGASTRLAPRVTLAPGCVVGARCIVHSGVVIGADGFGFAPVEGRWEKIEQLGGVRIGDDVEIGANTCIDRGALDDTVVEDGVKLDNLIQIAHNVRIGTHTAIAGCVGIAGSAQIGAHCTIGGAAMIAGHLTLADGVHISAGTFVMGSIRKPGLYSGVFPIDDNATWEKNAATLRQLHRLRDRLRALETRSAGSAKP